MPQTEQASRSVVFLSYSRADRVAAEIASRLLRDAGFSVWIDNTNLAPGTASWQAAIEQAINQSQIIVVLLSPEAKASEWVGIEVGYAKLINLRIIPVLFRGTVHNAVPLTLINTQWIDATQNVQAAIQEKLIPTLKQYLHANERSTNETIDHRLTTIAANGAPVAVLTSSPTPHSTRTEGNTGTSSHWWTMTAATVALVAVIAAFFLVSLMKDTANLTDQFNRQTTTAPTMVATAIAIQDRFAASIPTRLPVGKFGVVIAGFGFSEQESMVTASPLADEVSDIISSAMKEIPEIDIVQDWRSPGIGRILSAAPSERERQAAALAELLGADVVIYGTVSSEGLIVTIEPEFYIAPTSLTMIEPEIAGALRFETPSRFVHDSDDQLLTAASDLQQYMSETRVLMRGLGTYFGGNFPAAIEAFQQIIKANPTHGEILHLLAGNAAIREGQLSVAMAHYQSALAIQPDYGRAFIGKGNVYFQLARQSLGLPSTIQNCTETTDPSSDIDSNNNSVPERIAFQPDYALPESLSCQVPLDETITNTQELALLALDCYQQAKQLAEPQSTADLELKSALGLAQVNLWLAFLATPTWYQAEKMADAEVQLGQVLEIYQNASTAKQARMQLLVGHAYAWLGLVKGSAQPVSVEHLQEALVYYHEGVDLLKSDVNIGYNQCAIDLYQKQLDELKILFDATHSGTPKAKSK